MLTKDNLLAYCEKAANDVYQRVLADPFFESLRLLFSNENGKPLEYDVKRLVSFSLGQHPQPLNHDVYIRLRDEHSDLVDMGFDDLHFTHITMHTVESLNQLGFETEAVFEVSMFLESIRDAVLGKGEYAGVNASLSSRLN